jgi:hypothetical protein
MAKVLIRNILVALTILLSFHLLVGCSSPQVIERKVYIDKLIVDTLHTIKYDTVIIGTKIKGKDTTIIKYYPKYEKITLYKTFHDSIKIKDSIQVIKYIPFTSKLSYWLTGIGVGLIIISIMGIIYKFK